MSTTKDRIISSVARETLIRRTVAERVINTFLSEIKIRVSNGETIKISDFGTFEPTLKKAKIGRNPRTNEEILIPNRVRPTFKPADLFNQCVENSCFANNVVLSISDKENKKKGK